MSRIADFKDGERIYGQFLVSECNKCVSNKSKAYLNMTLQDASGTIGAKLWDVLDCDYETFKVGNLVELEGEILEYSGSLQLKIIPGCTKVLSAMDPSIDYTKFVPAAPEDKKALIDEFNGFIESINNADIKAIVKEVVGNHKDTLFEWPAAVRNHHNYVSGLLFHTVSMARLGREICKLYPSLNKDILLGGILIHDIGKLTELSGPIATQFTLEGKLVGHISIGHAEVKAAVNKLHVNPEIGAIMEHMILSHHGKNEFGSPVTPLLKEALVCSMIDDIDSKINILDKALALIKPGESTPKLFNLDDRYFYKPKFEE